MANGKTMQAVVNLAGSIDPSLGKAIEQAQKKISGLNVKALAVGAAVGGIAVAKVYEGSRRVIRRRC